MRIRTSLSALLLGMLLVPVPQAFSQDMIAASLELSPHCEEEDIVQCPTFDAASPVALHTPIVQPGSTMDLDLVLVNPNEERVGSFRVWISYDPKILDGVAVTMNDELFPVEMPGEIDFDAVTGYAKVGASSIEGAEPGGSLVRLGRITFMVKADAAAGSTPLAFYDVTGTTTGHTYVTTLDSGTQSAVSGQLGSLLVRIGANGTVGSASSGAASSAAVSAASSVSSRAPVTGTAKSLSGSTVSSLPSAAAASLFTQLQIQGVRIGSNEDTIAVTWDPLGHPKLQGYNVYYGNFPGQYLHRRSVNVASRGIVIDDLTPGKTYFVAVRGIDDAGQETVYSTEVSVEVGNPKTSTSPLKEGTVNVVPETTENPINTVAPEHPLSGNVTATPTKTVPGETGTGSALVLLLLLSAAIGTLLAGRRQWMAVSRS